MENDRTELTSFAQPFRCFSEPVRFAPPRRVPFFCGSPDRLCFERPASEASFRPPSLPTMLLVFGTIDLLFANEVNRLLVETQQNRCPAVVS
jgi:hypothetical protein